MVTYNGMADTVEVIEGLSDLTTQLDSVKDTPLCSNDSPKGAITLSERRQFIALGKNPATGEDMSLQEHHYRLIMMNATNEEWQGYHDRVSKGHRPT